MISRNVFSRFYTHKNLVSALNGMLAWLLYSSLFIFTMGPGTLYTQNGPIKSRIIVVRFHFQAV
jgi:hypothetical protein